MDRKTESVLYGRYIVAGGTSVVAYYTISLTLSELVGVWYLYASLTASILSLLVRFVLMRRAFRSNENGRIKLQFAVFLVVTLIFITLNTTLLRYLVEIRNWNRIWAQVMLSFVPFSPFYYLASRRIFFEKVGVDP
ncbi:MAG: GtrA family protein [Candidatus Pacebacteria bacterium]|nr:GtrA family protein [Candidatus Paceibacterota bacterium]